MIYIACVFKKFAEATARWYDAGERVELNALSTKTIRPFSSSGQSVNCYVFHSTPRNKYAGKLPEMLEKLKQPLFIQQSLHRPRLRGVALAFDGFSVAQG